MEAKLGEKNDPLSLKTRKTKARRKKESKNEGKKEEVRKKRQMSTNFND